MLFWNRCHCPIRHRVVEVASATVGAPVIAWRRAATCSLPARDPVVVLMHGVNPSTDLDPAARADGRDWSPRFLLRPLGMPTWAGCFLPAWARSKPILWATWFRLAGILSLLTVAGLQPEATLFLEERRGRALSRPPGTGRAALRAAIQWSRVGGCAVKPAVDLLDAAPTALLLAYWPGWMIFVRSRCGAG